MSLGTGTVKPTAPHPSRVSLGTVHCFLAHKLASLAQNTAFNPFEDFDLDIPGLPVNEDALRAAPPVGNTLLPTPKPVTPNQPAIRSAPSRTATSSVVSPTLHTPLPNQNSTPGQSIDCTSTSVTSVNNSSAVVPFLNAVDLHLTHTTGRNVSALKITHEKNPGVNDPPPVPIWPHKSKSLGSTMQRKVSRVGWKYDCSAWLYWGKRNPALTSAMDKFGAVWYGGRRRGLRLSGSPGFRHSLRVPRVPKRLMIT